VGEAEGQGDAVGLPLLCEAQPEGDVERRGERETLELGVARSGVLVSEWEPRGEALTLALPEGEPLAGGERDEEGEGEGDRVMVAAGVFVRVRVKAPEVDGERVADGVGESLGAGEAVPLMELLREGVGDAGAVGDAVLQKLREEVPVRAALLEAVKRVLTELRGDRVRLPDTVAVARGEGEGESEKGAVAEGEPEPERDPAAVEEGDPVALTQSVGVSLLDAVTEGERVGAEVRDAEGEGADDGVEEELVDTEGEGAPLREELGDTLPLRLGDCVELVLTLRDTVGEPVKRRDGLPVPQGVCVPATQADTSHMGTRGP